MTIVQAAWQAVRSPRRTQLRRAGRTAPLDDARFHADAGNIPGRSCEEEMAGLVLDAFRAGVVSLTAARLVFTTRVSGLPVSDLAGRLGCSPQSVRTRRARAERALARHDLGRPDLPAAA